MSETTYNLIQAMANGDALETEQAFGTAMAEKLAVKLDDMRTGIAQNMFNAQEPVVEESLDEAVAKTSIAHLAADHYHHVGSGSDYNDDATPKQQSAHRSKAKEILKKVEQHHGAEAAKDVEHHTNYAFAHDNTTGPGGDAGTHKKFAEKHLGGVGSAHHKEYTSRLEHHGYELGSDSGMHTNS
jgi:hypothetical protein